MAEKITSEKSFAEELKELREKKIDSDKKEFEDDKQDIAMVEKAIDIATESFSDWKEDEDDEMEYFTTKSKSKVIDEDYNVTRNSSTGSDPMFILTSIFFFIAIAIPMFFYVLKPALNEALASSMATSNTSSFDFGMTTSSFVTMFFVGGIVITAVSLVIGGFRRVGLV